MEQLNEEHRLRLRERDEQLRQMKAQIDELKRRAEPTAAGLRGEALERDIEELLRDHFPDDLIEPVKSGARGADILQKIRFPRDRECGAILWESKCPRSLVRARLVEGTDGSASKKASWPRVLSVSS